MPELRALWLTTEAPSVSLKPLQSLTLLHDVHVQCAGVEASDLESLRSGLSPWDVEFRASKSRHQPALNMEIVDQAMFNSDDPPEHVNRGSELNEQMLSSETEWLEKELEGSFEPYLESGEDYSIHARGDKTRSTSMVLLTDKAVNHFRRLASDIQKVLATAQKDWVVHVETEDTKREFTALIHANKILCTKKDEETLRSILKP
jgi:hypothetical protein